MKFNNSKFLTIIKVLIIILSITYFIYFVFQNRNFFSDLKEIGLIIILMLFLMKILNIMFLSNINLRILKYLNINLTLSESVMITTKNSIGNLSSPFKLGSGYKISYLKENYDLNIKNYILLNSFFAILNIFPIVLLFLSYGATLSLFENLVTSIFVISICILIFIFSFKLSIKSNFLGSLDFLNYDNALIQINNLMFFISNCIIVYLIAIQFNSDISFFSSVAFTTLGSFVNLINLTPGNIGIKESILLIFNGLHGYSLYMLIFISFLERFLSFVALFLIQFIQSVRLNN